MPRSSWSRLRRSGLLARDARFEACADAHDDYLGQQVTKLTADELTGAEFICHVDSDVVFSRRTTADGVTGRGRPRVLHTPHSELPGRERPWKRPTEAFLGWPVEHDFMRHPPFTYPRWLHQELRAHCERVHGVPIERYVLSRPPRGFSEFNALGAYAHRRHREAFDWVRCGPGPPPDARCEWYWSWGGLSPAIEREIASLLA